MKHQTHTFRPIHAWRWRGLGVVLIALLIAALAGPMALAAPRAQTGAVLRIGYLGAPNGDSASGALLAIDQINASGGIAAADGTIYQLELLTLPGAPAADTVASALSQFAGQGAVVILGPDFNSLLTPDNVSALANSGLPILSGATADTLTDADAGNTIFRTRAPERVYSAALATYLIDDLGLDSIAAVQGDVDSTEAVIAFEAGLQAAGLAPEAIIQAATGGPMAEEATEILRLSRVPQVVAMWGSPQDAVNLLTQLRDGGWTGRFAYRFADEAARANILPDALADGVIGVNSWSYAYGGTTSSIFLRDYISTFGQLPGPYAASAYDAIWFLYFVIRDSGPTPDAIINGLIGAGPRTLVQGTLHPVEWANGDLSRQAYVYELGARGGPTVVARFDDAQRLSLEEGTEVGQVPTQAPGPAETLVPTATLEGTWVQVKPNVLNVRNGPGFNYDKIGEVNAGDQLRVLGTVADFSWMVVEFQGGVGWVKAEYVDILGDLAAVSVIQPPPSPTPGTPTLPPNPDIVIDSVTLSPAQPVPNKPFTATVSVRNAGGGAAGRFAIAATWEPGSVYTATFVEGLAGGQTTQIQLSGTLPGTGVAQVGVVADLNNDVVELDEANNIYNITYRADYPLYAQQSGIQLSGGADWDLFGGVVDFNWDGANIAMRNGSKIGLLSGVTFESAHYDA
ncbi:MAG: ABC transporter substrate-binding protein, partial [Anaerolineae bacterium]|nr:ABC transporter substrate-binding protein [Anaerolineae bacterium]